MKLKKKALFTTSLLFWGLLILLTPQAHLLRCVYSFIPVKYWSIKAAYAQIKDPYNPSSADYKIVQKALRYGQRPDLAALKEMEKPYRGFTLITEDQDPVSGRIGSGTSEECILLYASMNKNFPGGLKRLADHLKLSGFKGDILYRIGGFPNVAHGGLLLSHVPYAFKPAFFQEAKRLGYKRILWLDTSIVPLVPIETIFKKIEEKGYFLPANGLMVGPYYNSASAEVVGIPFEKTYQIPSCSAGLFGINLMEPKCSALIDRWYELAHDPIAFFSPRSDQNILSVLMYQAGFYDLTPASLILEEKKEDSPKEALFFIDRHFVHSKRYRSKVFPNFNNRLM